MWYGYTTLIDDEVARLLDALEALGLADDTAVFYTSDHGGMVGAHGLCDKGPHMYDEEIRIPLVARLPGVTSGGRSDAIVYNMDLMPTILDIAGADTPGDLDAKSLMPVLRGEADEVREPVAYVEFHGHQGPYSQRLVRTNDVKYVFNAPDRDELYDLNADPGEMRNLIGDPGRASVLEEMRRMLLKHIIETGDPIRRFFECSRRVGS
jgi:arylsulfatase A-like enzyme